MVDHTNAVRIEEMELDEVIQEYTHLQIEYPDMCFDIQVDKDKLLAALRAEEERHFKVLHELKVAEDRHQIEVYYARI